MTATGAHNDEIPGREAGDPRRDVDRSSAHLLTGGPSQRTHSVPQPTSNPPQALTLLDGIDTTTATVLGTLLTEAATAGTYEVPVSHRHLRKAVFGDCEYRYRHTRIVDRAVLWLVRKTYIKIVQAGSKESGPTVFRIRPDRIVAELQRLASGSPAHSKGGAS